jgi:hypothetical protein
MLKVRCKNCNVELESNSTQTKCCGCDNLTSITGDKISAVDLSLVELINLTKSKEEKSVLSREDLQYQEARRTRRVKRLDFEVR